MPPNCPHKQGHAPQGTDHTCLPLDTINNTPESRPREDLPRTTPSSHSFSRTDPRARVAAPPHNRDEADETQRSLASVRASANHFLSLGLSSSPTKRDTETFRPCSLKSGKQYLRRRYLNQWKLGHSSFKELEREVGENKGDTWVLEFSPPTASAKRSIGPARPSQNGHHYLLVWKRSGDPQTKGLSTGHHCWKVIVPDISLKSTPGFEV